jgi:plastocyanin
MTLASLMVHDVTVVHAGTGTNVYGDTTKDWATATRTGVRGWVSQTSQSEVLDGREAQVSEWVVFLPPEVTVAGGDRIEWADLPAVTFEVDGPPNPARTPRGPHHIEARLRVVEG